MYDINKIMAVGLLLFGLVVVVFVLIVTLIRQYLYFKNRIKVLEKRNQKLEAKLEAKSKSIADTYSVNNERFNYFNAIFSAMKDGIVVYKGSGELIVVNPVARKYLHIDKHIFFKEDRSSYGAFYNKLEQTCRVTYQTKESISFEYEDGEQTFSVVSLLIPDRYNKSACLGVLAVVTDVTEARRIEQRRKEFVSNVSHEFRTPMTLISGYAEMLKMWDEVTLEERQKALGVIEQETKRLKKLVSELLTLSRLDSMEENALPLAYVDVEAAIDQILWTLEDMAAKKQITFISEVCVDYPILRANEQFFYQMMLNLIENGIKYNREQGFVKVCAHNDETTLYLSVSDNGVGMEEKHLHRIFDRFYRVDEDRNSKHGGNGIGLAIVRNAVTYMHGSIHVTSSPNEGSEFLIELPLKHGQDGGNR